MIVIDTSAATVFETGVVLLTRRGPEGVAPTFEADQSVVAIRASTMVRGHETSRLGHVTALSSAPTRLTAESAPRHLLGERLLPRVRVVGALATWCGHSHCVRDSVAPCAAGSRSCGCCARPKKGDERLLRCATLTQQPARVLRIKCKEHS